MGGLFGNMEAWEKINEKRQLLEFDNESIQQERGELKEENLAPT